LLQHVKQRNHYEHIWLCRTRLSCPQPVILNTCLIIESNITGCYVTSLGISVRKLHYTVPREVIACIRHGLRRLARRLILVHGQHDALCRSPSSSRLSSLPHHTLDRHLTTAAQWLYVQSPCVYVSVYAAMLSSTRLPVDSSSYIGNTMRYASLHLHHVFPVCLITLSIGISLPLLNGYTFSHLVFTCLFTPRCYRQLACPLLPLLSGLPFCDKVKAYLCFCSIAVARIKKPHQSSSSFSHTNSSYPLSISLWSSTPVASPILWRQHHRTPPGSTSCYCLEPRGSSLAIVVAATLSYASSRNSSSLRLNKQSPIAPSTAPSRSLPSFCILNLDRVQPLLPYLTSLHLARHV
jgi:hypothetical protein